QKLRCKGGVGLRAPGGPIIGGDGLAVAGRLAEAHVPGDHSGIDLAGEVVLHFLRHLQGQIGPPVKHGQQHAVQFQPGIQGPADDPHRVHQVTEALQSVVFALHRHQDGVRGAEGVQRQQFQRGGAVDEQEVVAIFYLVQRVPQKEFPALHADQFDPGAGQRLVGGENIAVFGVHQG
ncbi:RNA polymerase sigma factor sigM, partial [Dysosmobacter welbionis]